MKINHDIFSRDVHIRGDPGIQLTREAKETISLLLSRGYTVKQVRDFTGHSQGTIVKYRHVEEIDDLG